jgi:hypothetical protein
MKISNLLKAAIGVPVGIVVGALVGVGVAVAAPFVIVYESFTRNQFPWQTSFFKAEEQTLFTDVQFTKAELESALQDVQAEAEFLAKTAKRMSEAAQVNNTETASVSTQLQ